MVSQYLLTAILLPPELLKFFLEELEYTSSNTLLLLSYAHLDLVPSAN